MNSRNLLFLLKKEAEDISIENFINIELSNPPYIYPPGSMQYITNSMTKYNLDVFFEIKSKEDIDVIEDIEPCIVENFTSLIDRYMDENAPGKPELKRYIRLVSTYLAFIAKKPLHPVGMVMSGGNKVTCISGIYYCPLKNKQSQEGLSLCAYCVSRDFTEIS